MAELESDSVRLAKPAGGYVANMRKTPGQQEWENGPRIR